MCRYEESQRNWLDRKISIIAVLTTIVLFSRSSKSACMGDHKVDCVFHNLCSPQLWLADWKRCRSLQWRYSDIRPILFLLLSAFLSSKVCSIQFMCTWSVRGEIVLFHHDSFIWSHITNKSIVAHLFVSLWQTSPKPPPSVKFDPLKAVLSHWATSNDPLRWSAMLPNVHITPDSSIVSSPQSLWALSFVITATLTYWFIV